MTITANDMTQRAGFFEPVVERDADGQLVQGWALRFTVWSHVAFLRGSETVMAARMASKAPAIVTVRASEETERITSEWRCEIDGRTFNIREDPRPDQGRRLLAMLVEA